MIKPLSEIKIRLTIIIYYYFCIQRWSTLKCHNFLWIPNLHASDQQWCCIYDQENIILINDWGIGLQPKNPYHTQCVCGSLLLYCNNPISRWDNMWPNVHAIPINRNTLLDKYRPCFAIRIQIYHIHICIAHKSNVDCFLYCIIYVLKYILQTYCKDTFIADSDLASLI